MSEINGTPPTLDEPPPYHALSCHPPPPLYQLQPPTYQQATEPSEVYGQTPTSSTADIHQSCRLKPIVWHPYLHHLSLEESATDTLPATQTLGNCVRSSISLVSNFHSTNVNSGPRRQGLVVMNSSTPVVIQSRPRDTSDKFCRYLFLSVIAFLFGGGIFGFLGIIFAIVAKFASTRRDYRTSTKFFKLSFIMTFVGICTGPIFSTILPVVIEAVITRNNATVVGTPSPDEGYPGFS